MNTSKHSSTHAKNGDEEKSLNDLEQIFQMWKDKGNTVQMKLVQAVIDAIKRKKNDKTKRGQHKK